MNELRWILIALGAVLLVAIYLWGRASDKKERVAKEALARSRTEPQLEPAARFEPSFNEASDASSELEAEAHMDEELSLAPELRQPSPVRATDYPPTISRDTRRARVEPMLMGEGDEEQSVEDESFTAELPVRDHVVAPTISMSNTPPAPRRIERRKIVALRLAAPAQRYPGQQLRDALEAEGLQHGKYDVFHRLTDEGASVFSVASMVEPGTFDLEQMGSTAYSGVTLFAQLPGPIPGVHALQELVTCGKRLQESLGGTLQDERGVPLTVHRTERLRQEVVDFERGQSRDSSLTAPPTL
jgi:cell division protein ZipA